MTDRISPKDLRHGDKVWIITASNQCWWQTIATIDQDGPWLTATFEPESRPAKVGYATIIPQPHTFYGKDVDVIREAK